MCVTGAAFDTRVVYNSELVSRALLFIVVLTLTHRHNTMQSVVAGQAPITLERKKYLGSKKEAKTKKNKHTHSTFKDTREAKRRLADKPLKKEDEPKQKNKSKSR